MGECADMSLGEDGAQTETAIAQGWVTALPETSGPLRRRTTGPCSYSSLGLRFRTQPLPSGSSKKAYAFQPSGSPVINR